ncbi:DUF1997 domain-containing protein [Acaryochloris marina]|uniref:DUF1997 domain-containing protein n=1 Tax=Acaryochloris marina TaxID=155978 RepID=UPI0021C372D5|nr:DUF1997 domain-containing protein [Acaryochloris marina]BDM79473.1 hypothetical protein AM10699_23410 [Acaryochloris marina MBIC10699]
MHSSNTQQDIEKQLIPCPEAGCLSQSDPSSRFVQFVSVPHPELEASLPQALHFKHQFEGQMDLKADQDTVMAYLDAHQGWFCRCAHPMKVEPVGSNGYILSLGQYGSFGFEVEPQIGLELLPQEEGVYRIATIPIQNKFDHCYQVDFQAAMHLNETSDPDDHLSTPQTSVEWDLVLDVAIVFPQFILRLPRKMIQGAGDKLLQQIVRQISQRLTKKVQSDFHASHGIY